jgi:HK97 family phage major capsid protein
LGEKRAEKLNQIKALADVAKERDLTPEQDTQYNSLKSEIEGINKRMGILNEEAQRAAESAVVVGGFQTGESSKSEERNIEKYSFMKVLRAAANRKPLEGLEREMSQEAETELRNAGATPNGGGYLIPLVALRNIQKRDNTATGGSPAGVEGGYNVQTDVNGYITALREQSRVIQLGARYIPGAIGNIQIPRENAVYSASWKDGENATTAEKTPTYEKVSLSPKRLGGFVDVSNQLLVQTSGAFENYIRQQIMQGQAEGIDIAAIEGSGSTGEPYGILNTTGIGSVVGGTDGAAPDRDDLVDLWKAVAQEKGLQGSLHYLSNPKVFAKLAKTKTDSGSGIFVLDQNKSFMGYNFGVSNHVPSDLDKGTSTGVCSAIIFGNFQDLMITQWGGMEILVDPYTQALTGLTRMIVNTYADLAVLRPKSFAAMKDATTT